MNLANEKHGVVAAVWSIAEPIADSLGLIIWDIRFVKEGATRYLRIFIDKEDGVDINDCEAMSRAIDKPLDDADPIDGSYCLEVSSPGLERELTREEHFEMCAGLPVKIRLIRPDESGEKDFCGTLLGLKDGSVEFEDESGAVHKFAKKDTAWIKLDDFGGF